MLTANTILKSRYRIIQPLGRGGMGAVYQALDEVNNRLVAVKETFAKTDELRRAFRREAELLASIQHPALPFVIEHFREGSGQFLIMQFIAGYNLSELLRLREQPFAVEKVLEWAEQLLDALEEMHTHEPAVIHRDIKPSNLKLTPKGKIILLDFGLAKGFAGDMSTLEEGESLTSLRAYTRHYAPLEQLQGAGTDPRSDLYSLGATLWTLLTGVVPPDTLMRVAAQAQGRPDPLRPAHELNPKVPPFVSEVIHRAMSLYQHHRPETASDMRRALREAATEDAARAVGDAAEQSRRQQEEEQQREDERAAQRKAEAARLEDEVRQRHEAEEKERRRAAAARAAKGVAGRHKRDAIPVAPGQAQTPDAEAKPNAPATPADSSRTVTTQVAAAANAPAPRGSSPDEKVPHHEASPAQRTAALPTQVAKRRKGARLAALCVVALVLIIGGWLWLSRNDGSGDGPVVAGQQQDGQPASGVTDAARAQLARDAPASPPESPPANATPTTPPLPVPPPEMASVPGGTFKMGRDARDGGDEWEHPAHLVTVKPFFIDKYEVSNEKYAEFVRDKNWPPPSTWNGNKYPPGTARQPVTGVTFDDAKAYAAWAGKRLPTEAEWEFAARGGTNGFRYPWGNEWRAGLANADRARDGLANVGSYGCASPFGACDLIGNAWEWTATSMSPYPAGKLPIEVSDNLKVIRGGSFAEDRTQATATYRGYLEAGSPENKRMGFRCVRDMADGSGS